MEGFRSIGNTFAYVALLAWPLVCMGLFVALPVEAAAIWSLFGGYLLLPSGFQIDLPLCLLSTRQACLPPVRSCFAGRRGRKFAARRSVLLYALGLGYAVAPILTSLGNSYELQTATGSIPGFTHSMASRLRAAMS
jgi:hypothetical protein